MNRPNIDDYTSEEYMIRDYEAFIKDLEKYCDSLETTCEIEHHQSYVAEENEKEIAKRCERLEKALDKACEYLTYDHFTSKSNVEEEEMIHWYESDWKEFLLKDE